MTLTVLCEPNLCNNVRILKKKKFGTFHLGEGCGEPAPSPTFFWDQAHLISGSGWHPPPLLSEGLDPPLRAHLQANLWGLHTFQIIKVACVLFSIFFYSACKNGPPANGPLWPPFLPLKLLCEKFSRLTQFLHSKMLHGILFFIFHKVINSNIILVIQCYEISLKILTFSSHHCIFSNETSSAVLSLCTIYLVCSCNSFRVCGQNPMVLPFKWNLCSSTFTLYYWISM